MDIQGTSSKVRTVVIEDGKCDRESDPIHYTDGIVNMHHKESSDSLDYIKTTIDGMRAEQKEKFEFIKTHLNTINTKIDTFHRTAVGYLAKELGQNFNVTTSTPPPERSKVLSPIPPPRPTTSISVTSTPQVIEKPQLIVNDSTVIVAESLRDVSDAEDHSPQILNTSGSSVASVEEIVDDLPELISPSILTPIYVKSCSRRNFASRLVAKLFDRETRLRSNVNGRGKDKLDPEKIEYVKKKVFQYFPVCGVERQASEWQLCILSIDEFNRRLKKVKKEQTTKIP